MATKAEKEFMLAVKLNGCVICGSTPCDFHHITEGGRRLGHFYGIGLCHEHHEGKFSIGNAKKSFIAMYGTELELCQKMYKMLGMEYKLKESKVYGKS